MATDDEQQPDEVPATPPASRQVRGYRSPRYAVFVITGAVAGLVLGVVLATVGSAPDATGGAGVLGYLVAFGTLLGALAGGTVAVVAETLLNRGRRARARRPHGGTRRG